MEGKLITMGQEQRKFKRYIFPNDERMTVRMRLLQTEIAVEARLLNISEGGVGLAIVKNQELELEEESEMVIESMNQLVQLEKLQDVALKIRWIIDHKPLENMGVGCEFIHLKEDGRRAIRSLFRKEET